MKRLTVEITTIEPMLGMSPAKENIYRDFIGSKAPDAASVEDEVAALGVDAVADKMTVWPKDEDGNPFLWDYQLRGLGQWRNSGKGRFEWREIACEPANPSDYSGRRGA